LNGLGPRPLLSRHCPPLGGGAPAGRRPSSLRGECLPVYMGYAPRVGEIWPQRFIVGCVLAPWVILPRGSVPGGGYFHGRRLVFDPRPHLEERFDARMRRSWFQRPPTRRFLGPHVLTIYDEPPN